MNVRCNQGLTSFFSLKKGAIRGNLFVTLFRPWAMARVQPSQKSRVEQGALYIKGLPHRWTLVRCNQGLTSFSFLLKKVQSGANLFVTLFRPWAMARVQNQVHTRGWNKGQRRWPCFALEVSRRLNAVDGWPSAAHGGREPPAEPQPSWDRWALAFGRAPRPTPHTKTTPFVIIGPSNRAATLSDCRQRREKNDVLMGRYPTSLPTEGTHTHKRDTEATLRFFDVDFF